MTIVAIKKNNSYHSRFHVNWRRRREGKTDYYARKKLVNQDKRRYNSPKLRLVVRKTKRKFYTQLIQSRLEGDCVIQSITPRSLKTYGIDFSMTSFPVAYISGVLLANATKNQKKWASFPFRSIKRYGCKKNLQSSKRSDCKAFFTFNMDSIPKAILDIGLAYVTTGNKNFAVMKGAVDGGLYIPYNEKRFPGYNDRDGLSPQLFKDRITGKHVLEYMMILKEEDEERYNRQFSDIIKKNKTQEIYSNTFLKVNKFLSSRDFS